MGTNYYLEAPEPCPCCGRPYDRKHIGKSSAGWCFALHVYPDEGIFDLADWQFKWATSACDIVDEYGRKTTPEQMLSVITERASPYADKDASVWRYAVPGPRNLLRHKLNDTLCVAHGAGTWDCCVGDFR